MIDKIDFMNNDDWPKVRGIYLEGIATGIATFETEAPSWDKWKKDHIEGCSLVARHDADILGWAALSPVSGRCVYSGVAEVSVYIGEKYRGQGVGTALLNQLIRISEEKGYWTLQAGIFPENKGSIKLHQSQGFREVGRREKIGQLNGTWRDIIFMERRSRIVV